MFDFISKHVARKKRGRKKGTVSCLNSEVANARNTQPIRKRKRGAGSRARLRVRAAPGRDGHRGPRPPAPECEAGRRFRPAGSGAGQAARSRSILEFRETIVSFQFLYLNIYALDELCDSRPEYRVDLVKRYSEGSSLIVVESGIDEF